MAKFEDKLWVEKYRPRTIDDCIIPSANKKILQSFVETGEIPNLILASSMPGTGKTTTAKAIASQLGLDTLFINASLENGIDTIRSKIHSFVTTVSMIGTDGMKCVILDESDGLSPDAQKSLRGFIEQFSKNTRFIFTCNYVNKILPPIVSRCTLVDFNIPAKERSKLCKEIAVRVFQILKENNVEYDQKCVLGVITKHFPDFRRILNELQRYSSCGKIDDSVVQAMSADNYDSLLDAIRTKDFKKVREWTAKNKEMDNQKLYSWLFNNAESVVEPSSVPQLIMTLAEYQYKAAFVADQEINNSACFVELMSECEFK